MENQAFAFKAKEGKSYRGICLTVCGQTFVFGASLRGWFWRFGAPTCTPKPGYSESIFAIRTNLLIKAGMRDELVPVDVYSLSIDGNRNVRIRGVIHFSKPGLLVMSLRQIDVSAFPKMDSKSLEGFTTSEADDVDTSFYDYEE